MKTAVLLCSWLLPLAALAQRPVATMPPLTYHVGLTKAPLYHSLTDTFKQPSLLLPSQAEALVHAAGGRAHYLDGVLRSTYAGVVRHTLTIYVKDGRYKYILTNFTHEAAGTLNMRSGGPLEQPKASLYGYAGFGSQKPWADLKQEATRDARHLVDSLQVAMTPRPVQKAVKKPGDF